MTQTGALEAARTVADAVLFEGYLLYPYRSTSRKNQVRWQFGVLGPPGAAAAGLGEESTMSAQCVLHDPAGGGSVTVHLRFLQLQARSAERANATGFEAVQQLTVGSASWVSWDEAVDREIVLGTFALSDLVHGLDLPVSVPGGRDVEVLGADGRTAGRLVRERRPLAAVLRLSARHIDGFVQLHVAIRNTGAAAEGKDTAIATSVIGAHLLIQAHDAAFVSLLEPPQAAAAAVAACSQQRWWPVLAGAAGSDDLLLISPIILYDYPEVAEQSAGALFDSAEIDEILTLRVMTLTDEEKAEARATDPRAAEIIDRCDAMSPDTLSRLHGVLRDPYAPVASEPPITPPVPHVDVRAALDVRDAEPPTFRTPDVPWWDPEQDASVNPDLDMVLINGVPVSRGSTVRVHPSRRADAQDIFFAGRTARVSAVHSDVDGNVHVAVVLADDPAAEFHEWYGRYLYFAPDELEPLAPSPSGVPNTVHREESRS